MGRQHGLVAPVATPEQGQFAGELTVEHKQLVVAGKARHALMKLHVEPANERLVIAGHSRLDLAHALFEFAQLSFGDV